jgi:uncharacterized protein (DUF2062 family)
MNQNKNYNFFQKLGRKLKLNFIKLLRSPDGAKKVSLGFSIGFGLEMLVISTASLIYILFIPIVRLAKGSLPAAVIGNLIGKISFLPVLLLPIARIIGKTIHPGKSALNHHRVHFSFSDVWHENFNGLRDLLLGGIHVVIGMSVLGIILGIVSYWIVYFSYQTSSNRRAKKRAKMRELRA